MVLHLIREGDAPAEPLNFIFFCLTADPFT